MIYEQDVQRNRVCRVCEEQLAEIGKTMCAKCSKWGIYDYMMSVYFAALGYGFFYMIARLL